MDRALRQGPLLAQSGPNAYSLRAALIHGSFSTTIAARKKFLFKNLCCLALATGLAIVPLAVSAADKALKDQSIAELKAGVENEHPMTHLALATQLWQAGERDEAVFWFYLGQLRYRYHLLANPDLDPSGDPALFGSMMAALGGPLNRFALCDVAGFERTVERVLTWDEQHPNGFTPKTKAPAALEEIRNGLVTFRNRISAQEASITAQCAEKGRDLKQRPTQRLDD